MMPELFSGAHYCDAGVRPDPRPIDFDGQMPPAVLLNHTYACAMPSRGACCDCGVHPVDHLR